MVQRVDKPLHKVCRVGDITEETKGFPICYDHPKGFVLRSNLCSDTSCDDPGFSTKGKSTETRVSHSNTQFIAEYR